VKYDLLL